MMHSEYETLSTVEAIYQAVKMHDDKTLRQIALMVYEPFKQAMLKSGYLPKSQHKTEFLYAVKGIIRESFSMQVLKKFQHTLKWYGHNCANKISQGMWTPLHDLLEEAQRGNIILEGLDICTYCGEELKCTFRNFEFVHQAYVDDTKKLQRKDECELTNNKFFARAEFPSGKLIITDWLRFDDKAFELATGIKETQIEAHTQKEQLNKMQTIWEATGIFSLPSGKCDLTNYIKTKGCMYLVKSVVGKTAPDFMPKEIHRKKRNTIIVDEQTLQALFEEWAKGDLAKVQDYWAQLNNPAKNTIIKAYVEPGVYGGRAFHKLKRAKFHELVVGIQMKLKKID